MQGLDWRMSEEDEEHEEKCFGRGRDTILSREIRENERKLHWKVYIENHKARQIERFWEVLRFKMREKVVEELSRICWEVSTAKVSRWIENLLRIYRASRKFLDGSSSCWEVIENAIKRSWKGSIDSLTVKRCPTVVEIA